MRTVDSEYCPKCSEGSADIQEALRMEIDRNRQWVQCENGHNFKMEI